MGSARSHRNSFVDAECATGQDRNGSAGCRSSNAVGVTVPIANSHTDSAADSDRDADALTNSDSYADAGTFSGAASIAFRNHAFGYCPTIS